MSGLELFVYRGENNPQVMSVCLKPKIPFVLTPSLAHEIRTFQNKLVEKYYKSPWQSVAYIFWHLYAGNIKWKGFDFKYIYDALNSRNNSLLERYLDEVFDLLFLNYVSLDIPVINCSIVNRKVRGISQDFFFVNQINFIKSQQFTNLRTDREPSIRLLDIDKYKKKLSFPKTIYARNMYYEYQHMNLSDIGDIVGSYLYEPIPLNELEKSKRIFEDLKETTLATLYHMASKNFKLIERLAHLQSKSYLHKRC